MERIIICRVKSCIISKKYLFTLQDFEIKCDAVLYTELFCKSIYNLLFCCYIIFLNSPYNISKPSVVIFE